MSADSDIDIKDEPLFPSSDDNEVGYLLCVLYVTAISFKFAIVL